MSNSKTDKKLYIWLIASSFLLYLMTISIKMVYSAELVSIISYFGTEKEQAGLGLTIYYLIYALTQLIISSDKVKLDMYKFLVYTTVLSAISFGAVIFVNDLWHVWLILALNGILQSSVWGGIMYHLTKFLPESWFNLTSIILSFAFALGTAIAYGISALCVAFLNWKYAFLIFAALLLLSLLIFCVVILHEKKRYGNIDNDSNTSEIDKFDIKQPIAKKKLFTILAFVLIAEFFVCSVYYGLTNWIPNLLKEVHNVDESYSLLITILVPISMIPGPIFANCMTEKSGTIYTVCAAFFAICTACLLAMIFTHDANIVIALLLSLIALFFNRGIVNLLAAYLPFKLNRVIDAGKSSLMINAIACIGAAMMPFVTGLIISKLDWTAYYIFMFAISAITTLLFAFGMKYSKKLLP